MKLIPAIDLLNSKCVRLNQGRFDAATEYACNPIAQAKYYETAGANTVHIVDLEGAKSGSPQQLDIILACKNSTNLMLQMGGGLRNPEIIENVLASDIDRVVLGSLAVKQPAQVQKLIEQYGVSKFVLAFDVIVEDAPYVAISGWQTQTKTTLWDALAPYQSYENLRILCTDIAKDGMLTGPNFALYQKCIKRYPNFIFQASGGLSSLENCKTLQKIGITEVIIGKALYEKRFTLEAALAEFAPC